MDGHVDGHGPGDTRRHHPRTAVHQTAQPTFLSDSRQSLSRVKFIFFFFEKKKKEIQIIHSFFKYRWNVWRERLGYCVVFFFNEYLTCMVTRVCVHVCQGLIAAASALYWLFEWFKMLISQQQQQQVEYQFGPVYVFWSVQISRIALYQIHEKLSPALRTFPVPFRIPFQNFNVFLFWYNILFIFSPAISLAVILVWIGPLFNFLFFFSLLNSFVLRFTFNIVRQSREKQQTAVCLVFVLEDGTSSRDCFVIDSLLCFPRSFRLIIHRATSWNTDRYTFSCSGFRIFFSFLFGLSLSIWFGWNSLEKISFHQISE